MTLNFDKEANIYIGENGLGKTTILNCIYYILCNDYERLMALPFNEIIIKFKGENEVLITKSDVSKFISKNGRRMRYRYREDEIVSFVESYLQNFGINDVSFLDDELKDAIIRRAVRIFDVSSGYVNSVILSYFTNRSSRRGDEKNISNLIEMVKNNISERVIYLTTYRRIEKDYSDYFGQDNRLNHAEDDLIRFGMKDVSDAINNVLETIRTATNQGFNKMTGILLSKYANTTTRKVRKLNNNYDNVNIVLSRLGEQIAEEDRNRILEMISNDDIYDEKYKYLRDLIDELVRSYNALEKYDEKILKFTDTCNKYLNNKKFVYDPSKISLKIVSKSNTDDDIKLHMLSSGEKQIVSLFSRLYLESEKKCILLIDEPELSISMKWQKMLLPDIMRSQNCNFLLTVTHSPFIFDNEFDNDAKDIWYSFTKYRY
ncbi:MAG: AAA family ATPase [Acholeplasmatales bacterium]|nr:AAA family ATPase [Acholeplasmatales bacterium]